MPRAPLPGSLPPRGLQREIAAAYVGISPTKFDQGVDQGWMPKPKRVGTRKIWDRLALDSAFSALPDDGEAEEANDWDRR